MPLDPFGVSDPGYATANPDARYVQCLPGVGHAVWLTAQRWRVYASPSMPAMEGEPLERFESSSGAADVVRTAGGEVAVPFSLGEAYDNYVFERWRAGRRTRSLPPSVLDLFYRIRPAIPRPMQLTARRMLIRLQGRPGFPAWPFDESVVSLLRFAVRCALAGGDRDVLKFRWFWPRCAHAAAVLTHDVESATGLRHAVQIADLEEERGLRSSFNIVGRWYPIDWSIVGELRSRGFEIGSHGVYHDRSLFSSREEFERQLPLLRCGAERLGAEGFRSPATHRVSDWLSELPFSYDCTMPLSDPYEPQPGGCCSPWPFFIGDLVELPYTLPQDHTLFTLLRHRSIAVWIDQVQRLEAAHGLIQCVSHPDPGYLHEPDNRARYTELLDFLAAQRSLWIALPSQVARWWRERDGAIGQPSAEQVGTAWLDDGGQPQLLAPVATGAQ